MDNTINKTYEQLRLLPPGRVTARGWLREQLLRSKEGLGGRLHELEPAMIATPFHSRTLRHDVGREITAGWNAEQSGYYWYGYIQLAYALDDADMKSTARWWVDGTLENQRPDGYLGSYTERDNIHDDFNAWGTAQGLCALQAYYDATGREDVLSAVHRCLLWFCEQWAGDQKSRYCGQLLVFCMAWCHRHTGDARLLTFIDEYFDFLNRNDIFDNSINAMLSSKTNYTAIHTVALASLPKIAAAGYMATGREEYRQAAVNQVRKLQEKLLLPNGGLSGSAEYTSPISAITETEYCAFSFLQNTLLWLASVTGDPQYFDISERIALNGAQGARKKDEKAIAYLSAPNQILATSISDHFGEDMAVYAPCYLTACCPTTSTWVVPDYLYGMALTDREGGAYISAYGPARLDFDTLALETDTCYPFRDTVVFTVHADAPTEKTLNLRIPSWCKQAAVTVNGQPVSGSPEPGRYFSLRRLWREGDSVELRLPMTVSIDRLNDDDSWKHHPLVLSYGPLVFSLPIPESWHAIPGRPRTPLPEGWSWYEVEPAPVVCPPGDVYERPGLRKYGITWNVAIDEALNPADVQIHHHDGGYVWENPPLTLTLPGYKALYSYAPYAKKTHMVYQSPVDVQEPLTLTLVPYGCTALRITCIPRANVPKV